MKKTLQQQIAEYKEKYPNGHQAAPAPSVGAPEVPVVEEPKPKKEKRVKAPANER